MNPGLWGRSRGELGEGGVRASRPEIAPASSSEQGWRGLPTEADLTGGRVCGGADLF